MFGLVALILLCLTFITYSADPIVKTKCGLVKGSQSGDDTRLAQFLGIPYAAPPVGNKRWKPPEPAECWSGTFDANDSGPDCYQQSPGPGQSEDCLHLNVFTRFIPSQQYSRERAQGVPVFFWIYGGSNVAGSNSVYPNLTYIATQKDAIVVAPNYRLGMLGYLALKELSNTDPRGVSGNYAIMDIQLALRWVQENIAAFGGDPTRVTLLGQSSGGTNILSLIGSPSSKNLFSGAISLSASPNITMDIQQAEKQNKDLFLPAVGCANTSDVLGCLYALKPEKICQSTPDCYNSPVSLPIGDVNGIGWCGLTIADGVTVKNIFDATASGLIDVPLIIQMQQADLDLIEADQFRVMNADQIRSYLRNWFTQKGWEQGAFDKWNQLYSTLLNQSIELAFFGWQTDITFTCGSEVLAIHAGMGYKSPVYFSIVTYPPSHPYPNGDVMVNYAYHTWDYMGATQSWRWHGDWDPQPKDVLWGKTQLDMWYSLASTGKIDPKYGWYPINADPSFPKIFYVGVIGDPDHVVSVQNYSQVLCDQLAKPPLNFDIKFWLVNK